MMDRIEAMRIFMAAIDEGSLAGAGRRLGHSPAAVSRAIAFLEAHVGVELLHRTTRTLRLSEAGERYAVASRRVLSDLLEADLAAQGAGAAPRGILNLTGSLYSGAAILRPVLDAYLDLYPAVKAKLVLLDRHVNLVDEGFDVGLRIAHLPESSMIAVRVGAVHRVVCASPGYLAKRPAIKEPKDIAGHQTIAMTVFGTDAWTFPPLPGSDQPQQIRIEPRIVTNTIEATLGSAVEGYGLTRCFSYQCDKEVRDGKLAVVLDDRDELTLPVHLVAPEGRLSVPKVRAFVDFAVPRLKAAFARMEPR
jgi:DNA-binding transcriptional LysR family regulator